MVTNMTLNKSDVHKVELERLDKDAIRVGFYFDLRDDKKGDRLISGRLHAGNLSANQTPEDFARKVVQISVDNNYFNGEVNSKLYEDVVELFRKI